MSVHGVDLQEGAVRVLGKGGRERVVPVGGGAVVWVRRYLLEVRPKLLVQGSDRFWIGSRGAPLGYWGMIAVVRSHARTAGLAGRVSPHGLRRACATHMLRHGAPPLMIQQLLGHSSANHLGHYLRVSIPDLKATHAATRPGA